MKLANYQIDKIIQDNIQKKGLSKDISIEQLSKIKDTIRQALQNKEISNEQSNNIDEETYSFNDYNDNSWPDVDTKNQLGQDMQDIAINPVISPNSEPHGYPELGDSISNSSEKDMGLEAPEVLPSYKPELPDVIKNLGAEEFVIFDESELSKSAEALSNLEFRLKNDMDSKKSMHELWLESAKMRGEVYAVKLEKIGEIIFDPIKGVTTFERNIPISEFPSQEIDSVQRAIESQIPTEEMIDSVEPVTDVSLPLITNPPIEAIDVEAMIKKQIEDILINHYREKI